MTDQLEQKPYFDIIMDCDESMRKLYHKILEQLNQSDTDYIVEFKGETFDFCKPFSKEDKKESDILKRKLARMLFRDAISKFFKTIDSNMSQDNKKSWASYRHIWSNLSRLKRDTPREDSTSMIASTSAYEVDEGTSKDLDYDSIYIQSQRKDLSNDEKWAILLDNLMVQEEGRTDTGDNSRE